MSLQKLSSAIMGAIAGSLSLSFLPLIQHAPQTAAIESSTIQTADQNGHRQPISTAAANQRRPPDPPNTPPPNGTRPGGGLNPNETSRCALNDGLRALVPIENPVLTAKAHPTFLFYVPVGSEAVQYGEFSLLLWPNEEIRHYKTRFRLPESRGIVSVTIPEIPAYALAENQTYRWYFQLYDSATEDAAAENSVPVVTLHGSVQRVALTPERAQQIQAGSSEIWYDAIAHVAEQLQTAPEKSQHQAQWQRLLTLIEAEEISQTPFAGSVLPFSTLPVED